MIEALITNRIVKSFQLLEYAFCSIGMDGGYSITCETLLRYVGDDGTFITNEDNGHQFGLPQPYNAEEKIANLVVGKLIESVEVKTDTNDLTLHFPDGRLELLCSSAGYENYQLYGPNELVIVGHGGKNVDK